jgi:hypothetical protein
VDLDFEHLVEEVADLGVSQRDAVHSKVRRIIEHSLKLEYSVASNPRAGWHQNIIDARTEIEDKNHADDPPWPVETASSALAAGPPQRRGSAPPLGRGCRGGCAADGMPVPSRRPASPRLASKKPARSRALSGCFAAA